MAEQFVAIVACYYNGKRFRIGQLLPSGWEPNKHFMPAEVAAMKIKRDQYAALGFDPEREQRARMAVAKKQRAMKNTIEPMPDMEIDFTGDAESMDDFTRGQIAAELKKQFGIKTNWATTKKIDLIKLGQKAARTKE